MIGKDGVLLVELFKLLKKGYAEAFIGLYSVNEKQNKKPEDCIYVRKAYYHLFGNDIDNHETGIKEIVNKMKEFIKEYEASLKEYESNNVSR